jgi:hypothetical protein
MKMKISVVLAFLSAFAFAAFAADVNGKYTADVPGRQGNTQQTTFNLKSSGGTVSGTVANQRGEMEITDGKIDGDNISFSTTMKMQDREMKMNYKGKISGDSIDFTRTMEGMGNEQKFTAKKSAT